MRPQRIASLLEKQIPYIINQDLKDPRLGFITITEIVVSPDLKVAVVYFSSLGDKNQSLEALKRAKGYIKKTLAQRIRLRFIPELEFRIDNSYEYGRHVDELFKEISKNNKKK